jgi:hypothetical protein
VNHVGIGGISISTSGPEQVHQRAGVGARERVDVALEEGLPGLLVGLGEVVLHRSDLVQVGPRATQRAVDGRRRGVQHLGDLGRPERQHVAQRQHGALTCRQHLESGDEGEPHGTPAYHDRRRIIGVEQRVGHRLEPRDRALERGHGRSGIVRRRSGVLVLFGRGQDQRARGNPAGKPDADA